MLYEKVKRAMDVAGATAAIGVSAPVIGICAVAVWASMGRPVFFVQERPGHRGRPFRLVKFRTMRSALAGEGVERDGVRLTRVGRWLRSTSLDELPTFFNVLRGDMSLVGPRPLLMQYLGRYSTEQARRHDVKPGITGWAQVNGRNAISWAEKFALDTWYVDHRSLSLDVVILSRTVLNVLRRSGISSEGHETMPEFIGNG